jgi:hypothetical protein
MKYQRDTYQSGYPSRNGRQYACRAPDYEILPHSLPVAYVYHPGHDHNAMTHCLSLLKYTDADAETTQRQMTHCLSLLKYMSADAATTQGQLTHCLSLLKYMSADTETTQGQLTHCLSLLKYMGADTETTQGRTDPLFIVAEIYGC